jgi:hypothetical protein
VADGEGRKRYRHASVKKAIAKIYNSRVRSFSHTDKNFVLGGIYENIKEASK